MEFSELIIIQVLLVQSQRTSRVLSCQNGKIIVKPAENRICSLQYLFRLDEMADSSKRPLSYGLALVASASHPQSSSIPWRHRASRRHLRIQYQASCSSSRYVKCFHGMCKLIYGLLAPSWLFIIPISIRHRPFRSRNLTSKPAKRMNLVEHISQHLQ